MAWVYLFIAIAFEVAGTMCMKFSDGFSRVVPTTLIFVFYAVAFSLMTLALRKIELSVAYTVWAGTGTTIVALIGIFYFQEVANPVRVTSILFVIIGVIGLRMSAV